MIVLHDEATREYAYGPAQGLPDTKVGVFNQALYDETKSVSENSIFVQPSVQKSPPTPLYKRGESKVPLS